jgi:prepilin-type N-terminal cleavage/methylation domain-containing protein
MATSMKKGVTLIELMVVIAIISILIGISFPLFSSWMKKYSLESDTQKIYATLTQYRQRAFAEKKVFTIQFSGSNQSGDTLVVTDQDNVTYETISLKNTFSFKGTTQNYVTCSKRGTYSGSSLYSTSNIPDAQYNCISVDNLNVKMGKWNGSDCEEH